MTLYELLNKHIYTHMNTLKNTTNNYISAVTLLNSPFMSNIIIKEKKIGNIQKKKKKE